MLLLTVATAVACPSLDAILQRGHEALVDLRTDEVQDTLDEAERSLACGSPASPEVLGDLFLVEGVLGTVLGDEQRALAAFQALARTSRASFDDVYGDEVRAMYERAAGVPAGIGSIELAPGLGSNVAWLDGVQAPRLSNQIAGLHVVQVSDHLGAVKFGRIVYLAPDQILEVHTGVDPGPRVVRRSGMRKRGLLLAGMGAGLAGGGLFVAALGQNSVMKNSRTRQGLTHAFAAQIHFAVGGALALASAAVLTHQFGRANRKR